MAMRKGRLILAISMAMVLPLLVAWGAVRPVQAPLQFLVPDKAPATLSIASRTEIAKDGSMVHAVTMVPDGRSGLIAAWFQGSREGAGDVEIRIARFDGHQWDTPRRLIDRQTLSRSLGHYVGKLGNPVFFRHPDGTLHLFVVAVAYGGWATAGIAHLTSNDNGKTFSPLGLLPLSPFLNVSHLVRGSVIALSDGGFILPAYFEMGSVYPVLVHFDRAGALVRRQGFSAAAELIQPWPSVENDHDLTLFLRDMHADNRRVWSMRYDGALGQWEQAQALTTPNPNASVAAIAARDGGSWVALNPDGFSRSRLVLQKFDATGHVLAALDIANASDGTENSYPSIAVTPDGRTHLMYTSRRQAIAHVILDGPIGDGVAQ